ncbi:MAG TPA: PqqD family peptide modification chaperone [Anaerolineae bacterium]|nr:PqqD family peptide modification chaperone [Anaerolineae bacterium]
MKLWQTIKGWFEPMRAVPPGLYSYQTPPDAPQQYRLHLRVEKDGRGILLVNAAKVLHLNHSAAELVKLVLEERTPAEAARDIARRYDVPPATAQADYEEMQQAIRDLAQSGEEVCPVSYMDVERIEPLSAEISAPYRMDLALTYRCQNDCPHCYVGRPKDMPEMAAEEWKRVIDRCWELGIPHVTFTGGEATLRPDLPELVRYAESVGVVTGLQTNGRRLQDPAYLDRLLQAGLDHVQITLESHIPEVHDRMTGAPGSWTETVAGIRSTVAAEVYMMTNTTITTENVAGIEDTVAFAASLGVPTFGCNSLIYSGAAVAVGTGIRESELQPILERVKRAAEAHHMRLIWYTPTQYCEFDPTGLELGIKGCTAAHYNMCVEPNGDVIPCQSYFVSLGNLLSDPWDKIWEHELARYLRQRDFKMEKCHGCPDQVLCGGGCPLYAKERGEV